jgi:hypothetical protein
MFISNFTQEDGYWEAIAYFESNFPNQKRSVFRLRAIQNGDGEYFASLRLCGERGVVLSESTKGTSLLDAKKRAVELALEFLLKQSDPQNIKFE